MNSLTATAWPPAELALPNDLHEIERGRIGQRVLPAEQPDDSRRGRLARLLGTIPGVTTADRLGVTP